MTEAAPLENEKLLCVATLKMHLRYSYLYYLDLKRLISTSRRIGMVEYGSTKDINSTSTY